MYNGLEALQLKGSGLSGYVQRSKATMNIQLSKFRGAGEDDVPPTSESINPLEQRRSQKENKDLARRLALHKARRDVHLRVMLYRERREMEGVNEGLVDRECSELYQSLMAAVVAEHRNERRRDDQKSAERFAQAFGVKVGTDAFDRVQQAEEARVREEKRRAEVEGKLVDRLKKVREEADTA